MEYFDDVESVVQNAAANAYNAAAVGLRAQRSGDVAAAVDAPYVTMLENFAAMDHAAIYAAVQAMSPSTLVGFADLWASLGGEIGSAFRDFGGRLHRAMDGWTGVSRDAASAASRMYAATGEELGAVAVGISPRLQELGSAVSALRIAVPPPLADDASALSDLPMPAVALVKAAAAEELRMQAAAAMTAIYEPSYGTSGVGSNVPAYSGPVDPAPGFADGTVSTANNWSPRVIESGSSATDPAANQGAGGDPSVAQDDAPYDIEADSGATDSATTERANSRSADDAETSTEPNVRAASVLSPSVSSPSSTDVTRVTPDSASPGLRSTSPLTSVYGQPVPPQPVVASTPSPPSTVAATTVPAARTASSAMRGTPPFVPGAGAGQRRDDESEHSIPSYLITEANGRELFGELPKTAPPVLGDWTERT